ncbi:MAG: helix-turn-helix transcriptional regulator [Saprospiraceae bacterium]|nr:helix-turn-helix transcriptional regulator [Saprospiraceae bacterium]
MIGEDRIALNERFIKVFQLLEERGDISANDRSGKGIGDFAKRLLGNRAYGHIIRRFLDPKDKRVIDYRHAKKLCKEYGVNEEYLLEGIGTPFGSNAYSTPEPSSSSKAVVERKRNTNIIFTSKQAHAGSAVEEDSFVKENYEYFSIPGINGFGFVAFPIEGNSMEPIIANGDIVICKEVNGVHDVKDNEIYAVKTRENVWVKYVQRIYSHRGKISHLKLLSANYLEHDPFMEEVNDHIKLFKVVRKISRI